MKKLYGVICGKYRKFEKPKISYLLEKIIYKKMSSYCLKCRNNTESKNSNPKLARTKKGRIIILSRCAMCDSKKSKFNKQQEASKLLNILGTKKHL